MKRWSFLLILVPFAVIAILSSMGSRPPPSAPRPMVLATILPDTLNPTSIEVTLEEPALLTLEVFNAHEWILFELWGTVLDHARYAAGEHSISLDVLEQCPLEQYYLYLSVNERTTHMWTIEFHR